MPDDEHLEIKQLIRSMEKQFNDRIDRMEKTITDTLKETTQDTKENTRHIERILTRLESTEKDLDSISEQNREQHKEFYERHITTEKTLAGYKAALAFIAIALSSAIALLKVFN